MRAMTTSRMTRAPRGQARLDAERAISASEVPSGNAVMTQAGDENFPVAIGLLGRRQKQALLAIYGVARLIDDVGDEAGGDRDELLDWVDAELDRAYAGATPEHPAMQALATEVWELGLPEAPFRRLVRANRQDQTVSRYETFGDLLAYCELSAAPVGELVLHVFSAGSPDRIALSDLVCAGLQVTEHIQDVREDYTRGRVYMPREDLARFACTESDLASGAVTPEKRELIEFEVGRARALLAEGSPLAKLLAPRPRAAIAGFVAGGRATLDAIEKAGWDVWSATPRRTHGAFARRLPGALVGR
jgi:squalene synthase HpnC